MLSKADRKSFQHMIKIKNRGINQVFTDDINRAVPIY